MKKKIILYCVIGLLIGVVVVGVVVFNYVIYPIRYKNLVEKYANVYKLDQSLVYSVIKVESGFNKNAVSNAGAKGLMQLMPETADEIARKLNVQNFTYEMLFSPDTNIRFGCYYLNYLLNIFNGNVTNALAGYNAGFYKVSLWLENSNYSQNGTVTNPPIKETQNYIKKVNTAIKIYNKKLG